MIGKEIQWATTNPKFYYLESDLEEISLFYSTKEGSIDCHKGSIDCHNHLHSVTNIL
jgi:hypothetical protein